MMVGGRSGQRPLGLALVRGITRGTDGAVGRLICGIWIGCPVLESRPRKLPLPLFFDMVLPHEGGYVNTIMLLAR